MSETDLPVSDDTTEELETVGVFGPAADPGAFLELIVRNAVRLNVSDIHLKVGKPPVFRVGGNVKPVDSLPALSNEAMQLLADNMMDEEQQRIFAKRHQMDLARGFTNVGRVRANIFQQRGSVSIVLRIIPIQMPDPKALKMPEVLTHFSKLKRGMVLITGATGSGKSTTLAALIDMINHNFAKHIVTVEDPVEFLFKDKKSIISQREVGIDTLDFSEAMRAALRQDPDVILIGELRDVETINTAVKASDTGHLVLSTLHASGAQETITRILQNFPPEEQQTIRIALAANLKGVVSQRLLPRADGKGRIMAYEVMVVTKTIADMIEDPARQSEITQAIKDGGQHGMLSFDDCLFQLVGEDAISAETALANASNVTDLRLRLEGY